MSDTPETDALDDAIAPDTKGQEDWRAAYFSVVKHARSLERRLREAQQQLEHRIAQVEGNWNDMIAERRRAEAAEAERDAALREAVPREPTDAMLAAATPNHKPHPNRPDGWKPVNRRLWIRMWDAALAEKGEP